MIQEDYGVAASVGQQLLSASLGSLTPHALLARSREPRCSGRSKIRSPPRSEQCCRRSDPGRARARARNVELNDGAVLIAHKAVIHICLVNIPSRDRSIRIDSKRVGTLEGPGT